MWLIIVLFALAAIVGLTLAAAALRGRFPAVPSAVMHGVLALSASVLLIIAVISQGLGGPTAWALGLLVVAALGGLTMAFGFHARRKPLPKGLVVGHALIALVGWLLLLTGALGLL